MHFPSPHTNDFLFYTRQIWPNLLKIWNHNDLQLPALYENGLFIFYFFFIPIVTDTGAEQAISKGVFPTQDKLGMGIPTIFPHSSTLID